MPRHLVLVRHAKSDWGDPSLADHDRPLAPRGRDALPKMRSHLEQAAPPPDVVWCSSARRTVETLAGIRDALPADADVVVDRTLYGAGGGEIIDRLRDLDDEVSGALVVGHNPTMQDLGLWLAGSGDDAALAQLAAKLPTGAVLTLSFDGPWAELTSGSAHLDDMFLPRRPRS